MVDIIYRSTDWGHSWRASPIDGGSRGLIPWDIEESADGTLFMGTEIYDHPAPYRAPFWRSEDGGKKWTLDNREGAMAWHVTAIVPIPGTGSQVYALTEGLGLFQAGGVAGTAQRLIAGCCPVPMTSLIVDQHDHQRLYGGGLAVFGQAGGVLVSTNRGSSFHSVGPAATSITSLALTRSGSVVVAGVWGSTGGRGYPIGIRRARVPVSP